MALTGTSPEEDKSESLLLRHFKQFGESGISVFIGGLIWLKSSQCKAFDNKSLVSCR